MSNARDKAPDAKLHERDLRWELVAQAARVAPEPL